MAVRMLYEGVVSPGRRALNDAGRDRPSLSENDSRKLTRSQIFFPWPTASVLEHSATARTMSSVGLAISSVGSARQSFSAKLGSGLTEPSPPSPKLTYILVGSAPEARASNEIPSVR